MTNETIAAPTDDEAGEGQQQEVMRRMTRHEYLRRLLGGKDQLAWQAPAEIEDFDALLAQHAAQLRNATRFLMEYVLSDDIDVSEHAQAVGALTRMVRANIAIAKALSPDAPLKKPKTVRGVSKPKDPQD